MALAILALAVSVIVGFVLYWIGRGVTLNEENRAAVIAAEIQDPDALINLKTGEVIDPGTRKYSKAIRKGKVKFE